MAGNPNYEAMHEANAVTHRSQPAKPVLDHLRIEEAENGGHVVEHHFENKGPNYKEPETHVFAEPEGTKPKLPDGHVLHHIAKHMNIPHEIVKAGGASADEEEALGSESTAKVQKSSAGAAY